MYKKILVANDGSDNAFRALEVAVRLATTTGAELHSISVEELPRYAGTVGEVIEEKAAANGRYAPVLERTREAAGAHGLTVTCHVVVGHEVKSIVEFVSHHDVDLLVVGFMGHSALYDRVMGSTCQSLVRLAPCSVLVVK